MSLKDNFSPEFDNPILNVSRDRLNAIDMVESALAHVFDIQQSQLARQVAGGGEAAKTVIQSEMAQPKPVVTDGPTENLASVTPADNAQRPISPEEIAQMNELKADAHRWVDEIHGAQAQPMINDPDQIDDLRAA